MDIPITSEESQEFVQLVKEAAHSMENRNTDGFKKGLTDFNSTMLMLGYEHLANFGNALETFFSEQVLPDWDEKATAVLSSCMEKLTTCLSRQDQEADLSSELKKLTLVLEKFPLGQEETDMVESTLSDQEPYPNDSHTHPSKVHVDHDPILKGIDLDDPLLLKAVLCIDPTSIAFVPLAEQFCRMKHWEEAINICRAGLFHHPFDIRGLILLGRALWESGLAEEAEEVLEQARAYYEKGAILYKVLGEMAEQKGIREDAEKFSHLYEMIKGGSVQTATQDSTQVESIIAASAMRTPDTISGSRKHVIRLLEKLMANSYGEREAPAKDLTLFSADDRERLKNILRAAGENAKLTQKKESGI